MKLAEQVYQTIESLPEPVQQEILDFARFLRQREDKTEYRIKHRKSSEKIGN
jgi:hypothetical protein